MRVALLACLGGGALALGALPTPVLSAPVLSGAAYSDGGATVTVRFRTPTDRGGLRAAFPCSRLLAFSPAGAVPSGASCVWRDSATLLAELGAAATLPAAGASVALLSGAAVVVGNAPGAQRAVRAAACAAGSPSAAAAISACAAVSARATGSAGVMAPLGAALAAGGDGRSWDAPRALIGGPRAVGKCSPLRLDATHSAGAAGRALRYAWSVACDASGMPASVYNRCETAGAAAAVAAANGANGGAGAPTLTIPHDEDPLVGLSGGRWYVFGLTVTSWHGAAHSATKRVLRSKYNLPTVTIEGPSWRSHRRSAPLALLATVREPECAPEVLARGAAYAAAAAASRAAGDAPHTQAAAGRAAAALVAPPTIAIRWCWGAGRCEANRGGSTVDSWARPADAAGDSADGFYGVDFGAPNATAGNDVVQRPGLGATRSLAGDERLLLLPPGALLPGATYHFSVAADYVDQSLNLFVANAHARGRHALSRALNETGGRGGLGDFQAPWTRENDVTAWVQVAVPHSAAAEGGGHPIATLLGGAERQVGSSGGEALLLDGRGSRDPLAPLPPHPTAADAAPSFAANNKRLREQEAALLSGGAAPHPGPGPRQLLHAYEWRVECVKVVDGATAGAALSPPTAGRHGSVSLDGAACAAEHASPAAMWAALLGGTSPPALPRRLDGTTAERRVEALLGGSADARRDNEERRRAARMLALDGAGLRAFCAARGRWDAAAAAAGRAGCSFRVTLLVEQPAEQPNGAGVRRGASSVLLHVLPSSLAGGDPSVARPEVAICPAAVLSSAHGFDGAHPEGWLGCRGLLERAALAGGGGVLSQGVGGGLAAGSMAAVGGGVGAGGGSNLVRVNGYSDLGARLGGAAAAAGDGGGSALHLPAAVRACHGVHRGGFGSPPPRCAKRLAATRWRQLRGDLPEGEGAAGAAGADDFGALKQSLSAPEYWRGGGGAAAPAATDAAVAGFGRAAVAPGAITTGGTTVLPPPHMHALSLRRGVLTPGARYAFELQALDVGGAPLGAAAIEVEVNRPPAFRGSSSSYGSGAAAGAAGALLVTPSSGGVALATPFALAAGAGWSDPDGAADLPLRFSFGHVVVGVGSGGVDPMGVDAMRRGGADGRGGGCATLGAGAGGGDGGAAAVAAGAREDVLWLAVGGVAHALRDVRLPPPSSAMGTVPGAATSPTLTVVLSVADRFGAAAEARAPVPVAEGAASASGGSSAAAAAHAATAAAIPVRLCGVSVCLGVVTPPRSTVLGGAASSELAALARGAYAVARARADAVTTVSAAAALARMANGAEQAAAWASAGAARAEVRASAGNAARVEGAARAAAELAQMRAEAAAALRALVDESGDTSLAAPVGAALAPLAAGLGASSTAAAATAAAVVGGAAPTAATTAALLAAAAARAKGVDDALAVVAWASEAVAAEAALAAAGGSRLRGQRRSAGGVEQRGSAALPWAAGTWRGLDNVAGADVLLSGQHGGVAGSGATLGRETGAALRAAALTLSNLLAGDGFGGRGHGDGLRAAAAAEAAAASPSAAAPGPAPPATALAVGAAAAGGTATAYAAAARRSSVATKAGGRLLAALTRRSPETNALPLTGARGFAHLRAGSGGAAAGGFGSGVLAAGGAVSAVAIVCPLLQLGAARGSIEAMTEPTTSLQLPPPYAATAAAVAGFDGGPVGGLASGLGPTAAQSATARLAAERQAAWQVLPAAFDPAAAATGLPYADALLLQVAGAGADPRAYAFGVAPTAPTPPPTPPPPGAAAAPSVPLPIAPLSPVARAALLLPGCADVPRATAAPAVATASSFGVRALAGAVVRLRLPLVRPPPPAPPATAAASAAAFAWRLAPVAWPRHSRSTKLKVTCPRGGAPSTSQLACPAYSFAFTCDLPATPWVDGSAQRQIDTEGELDGDAFEASTLAGVDMVHGDVLGRWARLELPASALSGIVSGAAGASLGSPNGLSSTLELACVPPRDLPQCALFDGRAAAGVGGWAVGNGARKGGHGGSRGTAHGRNDVGGAGGWGCRRAGYDGSSVLCDCDVLGDGSFAEALGEVQVQVAQEHSTLEWAWSAAEVALRSAAPRAATRIEGGGGALGALLLLVVYALWCCGSLAGLLRDRKDKGRRRVSPESGLELDPAYADAEVEVYVEAAKQYAAAAKVYAGLFGEGCAQVKQALERREEALGRAEALGGAAALLAAGGRVGGGGGGSSSDAGTVSTTPSVVGGKEGREGEEEEEEVPETTLGAPQAAAAKGKAKKFGGGFGGFGSSLKKVQPAKAASKKKQKPLSAKERFQLSGGKQQQDGDGDGEDEVNDDAFFEGNRTYARTFRVRVLWRRFQGEIRKRHPWLSIAYVHSAHFTRPQRMLVWLCAMLGLLTANALLAGAAFPAARCELHDTGANFDAARMPFCAAALGDVQLGASAAAEATLRAGNQTALPGEQLAAWGGMEGGVNASQLMLVAWAQRQSAAATARAKALEAGGAATDAPPYKAPGGAAFAAAFAAAEAARVAAAHAARAANANLNALETACWAVHPANGARANGAACVAAANENSFGEPSCAWDGGTEECAWRSPALDFGRLLVFAVLASLLTLPVDAALLWGFRKTCCSPEARVKWAHEERKRRVAREGRALALRKRHGGKYEAAEGARIRPQQELWRDARAAWLEKHFPTGTRRRNCLDGIRFVCLGDARSDGSGRCWEACCGWLCARTDALDEVDVNELEARVEYELGQIERRGGEPREGIVRELFRCAERDLLRKKIGANMLAEARLEQSLRFVTAPLREARLHEVARATNLSRMQRAQYYLNGLELDALPNPGPIRYWCLVWAVAVAYCGLCSAYLWGEFLARRGAALVSMWVVAFAVSLAQEVFVVAPLKTLLLHVLAPRLVEPALLNVEEGEAMHAFKDAMTRGLDLSHAVQIAMRGGIIDPDLARVLGLFGDDHGVGMVAGGVELTAESMAARGAAGAKGKAGQAVDYAALKAEEQEAAEKRAELVRRRREARKKKKKLTLKEKMELVKEEQHHHHAKKHWHFDLPHILNAIGIAKQALLRYVRYVVRTLFFLSLIGTTLLAMLLALLVLLYSDNFFME